MLKDSSGLSTIQSMCGEFSLIMLKQDFQVWKIHVSAIKFLPRLNFSWVSFEKLLVKYVAKVIFLNRQFIFNSSWRRQEFLRVRFDVTLSRYVFALTVNFILKRIFHFFIKFINKLKILWSLISIPNTSSTKFSN